MLNNRQFKPVDVDFLVNIDIQCFTNPWTVEHWRKLKNFRVYHLGERPVAYCVSDDMTLTRLAVLPAHRGRGIGTALHNDAVINGAIMLKIHEHSPHVSWFLKRGWKGTGCNGDHYILERQ